MPPCRTTLEIRGASMPDSRATMVSASSDEARCCTSKSAGTYSASITGVIGSTLSSRTAPLHVCDSVAAVAMAGFARSVSARSIGTRMDLNIGRPPLQDQRSTISRVPGAMQRSSRCFAEPGPYQAPAFVTAPALQRTASRRATRCAASGARGRSARLQQFRADEQLDPAAPERDVVPVVDVEVDYGKARGRQIVGERAARLRLAAAGERERQFVQAGIVPDQQQPLRILSRRGVDDPQQIRRVG